MMKWLRLMRWPNLLIVILLFVVFRYNFLEPFHVANSLSGFQYFLLMLSYLFVMAGGNVVNDIYDRTADRINKPGKNVVGSEISEKAAFTLYWSLSITGTMLGYFMGYTVGIPMLGSIHLISFILLWMYSSDFKHRAIIGNAVVALFISSVIICIVLFDVVPANQNRIKNGSYNNLLLIFLAYTIFAFVTTFIREIIKDAQDVKGDRRMGSKTLPILVSATAVKIIVNVLQALLLVALAATTYYFRHSIGLVLYIIVLLILPLAGCMYTVAKAKNEENWGFASKLMKLIMVFGIVSVVVFTYA